MIQRTIAAAASVAVLASVAIGAQSGRTLIKNEFTASAEGWTITGDAEHNDPFDPTHGNPGGCLTGIDAQFGETWFFHAPPAVVQQLPAAINGTIAESGPSTKMRDGPKIA